MTFLNDDQNICIYLGFIAVILLHKSDLTRIVTGASSDFQWRLSCMLFNKDESNFYHRGRKDNQTRHQKGET